MTIDDRVRALEVVLPEPFRSLTGTAYPCAWVRVPGNRASISRHLPLQNGRTLAEPQGKVGDAVTIEQGDSGTAGRLGDARQSSAELSESQRELRVLGVVNAR